MLTPEAYDRAADDILELYAKLDESITRDIARRLVKTGEVTATANWQINRAQESGMLLNDIVRQVASHAHLSEEQVAATFQRASIEALQWDMEIYEAAGLKPLPLQQSPSAARVLQAGIEKTNGDLQNLTRTTAIAAQRSYISASTLAEMQVESGAFDYVTAIRNAVRSAAADGAMVIYPSGHVDRLDVAVRRSVLTGVGQTTAQISEYYADDMGCDLVETTAHPGARPEHAEWQGRVFSRSGKHKRYPDFVKSTGYGSGDGLCGWNCRHSFYPFFEGLSARAYPRDKLKKYERQTVTFNGQEMTYYEATQAQRGMEREIRATKRELVAFEEGMKSNDPAISAAMREEFNAAAAKLKDQEGALARFVLGADLPRQREREQVDGFGRSQAQKAVWAGRKAGTLQPPLHSGRPPLRRSSPPEAPVVPAPAKPIAFSSKAIPNAKYRGVIEERFSKGNQTAQEVFRQLVPEDAVENRAFTGSAHYHPGTRKINMNFTADAKNVRGPGTTYFHEHGHLIDDTKPWQRPSHDPGFKQAIQDDLSNLISYTETKLNTRNRIRIESALSKELRAGGNTYAGVSDVLGGLTDKRIQGDWGHSKEYWDYSEYAVYREAFAHMYEAQFDEAHLAALEKYFPKATEVFNQLLEGLLDD